MARSQSPNSANSQFFICFTDAPWLNTATVCSPNTFSISAQASPGKSALTTPLMKKFTGCIP